MSCKSLYEVRIEDAVYVLADGKREAVELARRCVDADRFSDFLAPEMVADLAYWVPPDWLDVLPLQAKGETNTTKCRELLAQQLEEIAAERAWKAHPVLSMEVSE